MRMIDIRKLGVRDVQELCQLNAVGGRLIEHNDELGVCKHRSRRMALQEVVHILRNAGRISTVLAHSLPKRE